MRNVVGVAVGLILLASCGGGGGDQAAGTPIPAAAKSLDDRVKAQLVSLGPIVARVESSFLFIANPGTPMAQGIVMQPDLSPGAPANSFTYSGVFDGNGDGHQGTTISAGRATFGTDPNTGWSTVTGEVTLDIDLPLFGHVYHGTVAYEVTSTERRLSGTGTATIPLTGVTAKVTVPANTPLVVKTATGAPGAVANACRYSLDGAVQVEFEGPTGVLRSVWNFSSNNASASIRGATFVDPSGQSTAIPDSSLDMRCGSGGTIGDWAATFLQDWVCLPRESGQARLTITVTGPDTITIADEDPPGSAASTYAATLIGSSPRTVKGFFIAGPPGNTYREDFSWSLAEDGSGFSQFSTYTYQEGLKTGTGGVCVGSAQRVP